MTNKTLERVFQVIAVILVGVAAFFLFFARTDAAFISAVLGSVAFFLSIRFQVKERVEERDLRRLERENEKNRIEKTEPAETEAETAKEIRKETNPE